MRTRKPEPEDMISYEGEIYRVLWLLSSQFVCECISNEEKVGEKFISFTDAWKKVPPTKER